jgi:Uma2 family endonuclease
MAILEHELQAPTESRRHVFNRAEYYKMAEAGLFDDERVELIEGDIITLPPPGPRHRKASLRLYNLLYALFGQDRYVLHESPIVLTDVTEPLPDVSIAKGREEEYDDRHPDHADICLAVEVSDSTLRKDRKLKQGLYGGKGIPEYWIANLVDKQLEVYRSPSASGYAAPLIYRSGDTISTLFAPDVSISVSDFLSITKPA